MRQAIRQNRPRQQVARIAILPSPTRGWNTRDPLAAMRPDDAVLLDNWFPDVGDVRLRRGFTEFADIGSGDIESIMDYTSGSTVKLLVVGGGVIADITQAGTATSLASCVSNQWQHENFGGYLVAVNGTDTPINYNGSAVATSPAITGTGLTATNLISICAHKQRLWFAEKDTLNAWYLGTLAIGGAASKFDLSSLCRLGGTLQAIASWTVDAGAGADDFLAFITSEGEVLVYQGTDPASASTWALQGVYRTGRPIGRRCTAKLGGELCILTDAGVVPLSAVLTSDRAQSNRIAVSARIDRSFLDAAARYGAVWGWQAIVYPTSNMLICNIPQYVSPSDELYYQYVMNTSTGAWCRFTGMNARCWGVLDGALYFGGADGKVYQADTGLNDNGSAIEADLKTSFQYVGGRGAQKRYTMARPQFVSDGIPSPSLELQTDFVDREPSAAPTVTNILSAWDVALWDVGYWAGDVTYAQWVGASGIGQCVALRMSTSTTDFSMRFVACDVVYEPGAIL